MENNKIQHKIWVNKVFKCKLWIKPFWTCRTDYGECIKSDYDKISVAISSLGCDSCCWYRKRWELCCASVEELRRRSVTLLIVVKFKARLKLIFGIKPAKSQPNMNEVSEVTNIFQIHTIYEPAAHYYNTSHAITFIPHPCERLSVFTHTHIPLHTLTMERINFFSALLFIFATVPSNSIFIWCVLVV